MALTRATKIVATIGTASGDLSTLIRMITAGVDVVRLNFSRGKAQGHIDIPIFAITSSVATQRKGALYRNVRRLGIMPSIDCEEVLMSSEALLLAKGIVQNGDLIVMTWGDPMGQAGGTNALKIMQIGKC